METEKIQVVLNEGQTELIIREGKAPDLIPIIAPIKLVISGTIDSVMEFLAKRFGKADELGKFQIDQRRCHILVNREKISIALVVAENDPYLKGSVVGKLELHPKFIEFGINTKKNWEPNELGQFCKMNRAFFPDKAKNMSLVTELKNFVANINSKIEKQKDEKGSFKDNFSGVVTSNLPGVFSLNIPLFKGIPAEIIEVEFYASVDGISVSLQLFSPGANQLAEEMRDEVLNVQIRSIENLCPDIAIIEE